MKAKYSSIQLIEILKKQYPDHRFWISQSLKKDLHTRFACRKIVQNMAKNLESYELIVLDQENRTAEARLNRIENEAQVLEVGKSLVEKATQGKSLDYTPSAVETKYENLSGNFDQSLDLREGFDIVSKILRQTKESTDNTAGILSNSRELTSLATTDGGDLRSESSAVVLDTSFFKGINEITFSKFAPDYSQINVDGAIDRSVSWLALPEDSIEPGSFEVVMSADALSQVLMYAIYMNAFNRRSVRDGISPLKDSMGKKWVSDLVTIQDNPEADKSKVFRFDSLGHLRKKHVLVENGKVANWLYNEREAGLDKVDYFGNTTGFRSADAWPYDLEMLGGKSSVNEMLDKMGNGLYINNLHYLSVSDPQKMTIFGLTRGGFFTVEDGKISRQLANMRFEISVPELFSNISDIGEATENKQWSMTSKAPSVLTSGFKITDHATRF